jgi:hypothetical protein
MPTARALRLIAENRARDVSDSAPAIRTELQRILASAGIRTSQRSRLFLEYVVDKTLARRFDELSVHPTIRTSAFCVRSNQRRKFIVTIVAMSR